MAAAAYFDTVQKIYIAFYQRPADPAGLKYWAERIDVAGGNAAAVVSAFATSPEAVALYGPINATTIGTVIDGIYMALFNKAPDAAGKQFYVDGFTAGTFTAGTIALNILNGAANDDAVAVANKLQVANNFTQQVDGRALTDAYFGTGTSFSATYSGDADAVAARDILKTVTSSPATVLSPSQVTEQIQSKIADAGDPINGQTGGQTFLLTTGVDNFVGGASNDVFTSNPDAANAPTLTAFDNLDGGAGNDTLNINVIGAYVAPTTATVKNIEIANLTGAATIEADASGWTGLNTLKSSSVAGATLTAAATTAVTATDSALAGGAINVNGGSTVNVTASKSTTGTITVGATTAAAGAVTVSNTSTGAALMGAINVVGGTTVSVTQAATNTVATTATMGTVNVAGNASTTSVTVTNAKAATASGTVAGVTNNTVTISDVNAGSGTNAGTITNISVNGYTGLNIADNALTSLSVANGSGNIIIDNSGLTTPTNKTLALTANGLTGGTLDDADIYTTLNVNTTGANSTLANVTMGGLTALTVAGDKALTLTSTAGLSALKTVTVSGSAGLKADLSMATLTDVNAAATSGNNTVTIDASKATYEGGSGIDSLTTTAAGVSKAISLGDGDDTLTLGLGTVTAAIAGGNGTDLLVMAAATAAIASGSAAFAGFVTGFERLTLTGATNQTIDLAALGNYNYVSTSGGNGLTLNNLSSGGTLELTGAGTAYTIANSAFTAGTNDTVNLKLTDGSSAGVSFASAGITASGVENFVITTADTQAIPTGAFLDAVTLLGNSVKTIAVSGNAGFALTAMSTALTSVDASGIALSGATPGFTWTSGALTGAATVKGSATGTNIVNFAAATGGAVTYTGGSGDDTITGTNGLNNVVSLGDGSNVFIGTLGNNTITGGSGADTVTVTAGNNTVSLGNGTNIFTAGHGNNTYVGGTGVDTVTVGGGANTITTGTGADVIIFTGTIANGNSYSTITDIHAGVTIDVAGMTAAASAAPTLGAKVTLADTAVFQDFLDASVSGDGVAAAIIKWFQFSGNTYVVVDNSLASTYQNGVDNVIKLTGLVDLSSSTVATDVITIV